MGAGVEELFKKLWLHINKSIECCLSGTMLMGRFKKPPFLIALLLSLTLLSVKLEEAFFPSLQKQLAQGESVNILLLGIDARPDEDMTRSDAIILVSMNKKIGRIILLSIPRDTRVEYKGHIRKINMLSQLYGPEATCRQVSRLLGVPVSHYVLTNFKGFEEIIDQLGGVYVDVDVDIRWYRQGVIIKKGPQRLNGREALAYARFRGGPDADIGRTARQQKLLVALFNQLKQKENLSQLPGLLAELSKNIDTNLSFDEIVYLSGVAYQIGQENIITQTLPGRHYWCPYSGASYWIVDEEMARSILPSLYEGTRFEVMEEAGYQVFL